MLFDLVFTQAKGFRIAKNAALQFLESGLTPTDEASVLLFSGGRSLDVRKLPTRDHDAVREAVESLNISDLLDRVFNESEIVGPRSSPARTLRCRISDRVRAASPSEIRILAGNFIWALKSFAQALRSQPGQKHVILYSKGIASATIGRGQAVGTYSELSRGYAAMCKELAAAGISGFPVNTADPDAFKVQFGTGETTCERRRPRREGDISGSRSPPRNIWRPSTVSPACIMSSDILSARPGTASSTRSGSRSAGLTARSMRSRGYFNPKPFADYSKLEKEIHLVDLALSAKPISQDPARFVMQALPVAGKPPDNVVFVAEVPKDRLAGIEGPESKWRAWSLMPSTRSSTAGVPRWLSRPIASSRVRPFS